MALWFNFTNNDNEIYLELSIFYNIPLFFAGILMILSNAFYFYIILKFKLTKLSIQYILAVNLSAVCILLGLHHLIIATINIFFINPHETSYNFILCKVRSVSEIFLLYIFESTFATRVTTFVIMLNYPIHYRNTIDSNNKGKFVIIPIIIVAILATIFFTYDSLSIKNYRLCSLYSSFGPTYEKFFIALIGAVVILTVPVVYLGTTAIKKFKTEGKYKNSVIQLLNYEITVFFICWFLPNMCIFVCYFIKIEKDQMGMIYDISSLTLTISGIVEFPFTLWKNRDVKICFYKIFGNKATVIIGGRIEMKNFKVARLISKNPTGNKLFNVQKY